MFVSEALLVIPSNRLAKKGHAVAEADCYCSSTSTSVSVRLHILTKAILLPSSALYKSDAGGGSGTSAMSDSESDPLAPPRSPVLEAVKPKLEPSPTPPPFILPPMVESTAKRKKKPGPTQGDFVLVNFLGNGNHPDIASRAGREALRCSDSDEEMEDLDAKTAQDMAVADQVGNMSTNPVLQQIAQKTLPYVPKEENSTSRSTTKDASILRKDGSGVAKPDGETSPIERMQGLQINGVALRPTSNRLPHSETDPSLKSPTEPQKPIFPQGYRPEESLAHSPLSELMREADSAAQKLPALQNPFSPGKDGPGSPQNQKLPSVTKVFELAEQANHESEALRRRQSSFSVSPTLQFSMQQRSPAAALPPLSHSSPPLIPTETSPRDCRQGFSPSSTGISNPYFPFRRTSAGSETSPTTYQLPLASASTSSTDGTSPSTQPTPIETHPTEGKSPVFLPPPIPSIPQIAHVPAHGAGGFKCDHPGCTAAPFQTQYLLKFVFPKK